LENAKLIEYVTVILMYVSRVIFNWMVLGFPEQIILVRADCWLQGNRKQLPHE
jgi:hypothetical protein